MASYVGNKPTNGEFAKLDDISSGFNGSANTFSMTESGRAVRAGDETQLLISLNGVLQEPLTDFVLAGTNQIQFSTAPASSDSFFGIVTGNVGGTAQTLTDGIVTSSKLANTAGTGSAVQLAANTTTLTIAANGNVGVGTTSPTRQLEINGGTENQIIKLVSTDAYAAIGFQDSTSSADSSNNSFNAIGALGNDLTFFANNVERLRIDSSGYVGIGMANPATFSLIPANRLVVGTGSSHEGITIYSSTSTAGTLAFADGTSGDAEFRGFVQYHHNGDYMRFYTAAAERMRIDSSGNLLIGTSTNPFTVSGANGNVFINGRTNSNSVAPLRISKQGDSGNLLDFQVNGGNVGTIFTSGGKIYLRAQDAAQVGLQNVAGDREVEFDGNIFYPVPDNTVNLGASSLRWKDLYLSGGIYLGGTDAANYLDDYEEGDYTATITPASGSVTLYGIYNQLSYTKVGRMVTVMGQLVPQSVSSPSGVFTVNLPFVVQDLTDLAGRSFTSVVSYFNGTGITNGYYNVWARALEGTSEIQFYGFEGTAINSSIGDWLGSGSDIIINITYFTSA